MKGGFKMRKLLKDKRGITLAMTVLVAIIVGIVAITGVTLLYTVGPLSIKPVSEIAEADGEFDDVAVPEEVGGTDLVANATYSVTSEVFSVDFTTDVDLNGTDGNTQYLAYNFEIAGGGLEDFDANIELSSTIATTELTLKTAYIMLDEEGLTLDSENALLGFIVDVDTDLDKIDIEADLIEDGEYILMIEAKSLATVTIAGSEELMTIEMDGKSDDSDADDSGTVTIYNHA